MFTMPIDKEQLELCFKNFERVDNIILYKQNGTNRTFVVNGENAHPISNYKRIKDITECYESIKNNVDVYYGTGCRRTAKTWYKKQKYNSVILTKLIESENILRRYGLNVDTAVKFICSLINTSIDSQFNKPMDAVIGYRCGIGQDNFYSVLAVFCRLFPNVITMQRYDGEVYVKVCKHILLADPYIKLKANNFKPKDRWIINLFREDRKSVYFTEFTQRIVRRKLRETIMAITFWYNDLAEDDLKTKSRKRDEELYGERTEDNIKYIEVPIHIISMITGLSAERLLSYINRWAKRCNYLSKHNLGYSDADYYNPNYKQCGSLLAPDNLEFNGMEGRPPITPASYIIYMDNFENTKLYKFVMKHEESYKHLICRYIGYIQDDKKNNPEQYKKYAKDFIELTPEESTRIRNDYEQSFKQKLKENKIRHPKQSYEEQDTALSVLFNGDIQQGQIVSRNTLMKLQKGQARREDKISLKQIEYIDEETGELKLKIKNKRKLPTLLYKSMNYLSECPTSEFKGVIKVIEAITYHIKQTIRGYKIEGIRSELAKYKSILSHYNLYQQFEVDFES